MKVKILTEKDLSSGDVGVTILDSGRTFRGHKIYLGADHGDCRRLHELDFLHAFQRRLSEMSL